MKFTKAVLGIMCSLVLLCGCAKNSDIVLKINNQEITRGEFYDGYKKILNIQLKNAPKELKKEDSYMSLMIKDKYTNDFIAKKLLDQEYDKRKIEATPEEIKAKKAQIIAQIGSEEKYKNILKENNISEEKANEDFASEVKIQKLVNKLIDKEVTDAEAEKFYNANKKEFSTPERVQVSHILIDTNPESIKRKIADSDKNGKLTSDEIENKVKEEVAKKQQLAKEVQQKASKNPKEFAKLANEYSEDEVTAKKGGDLGYITKDQVVKEFSDAAFKQKVGTVSQLVKTEFGEHIIYVKDKSAAGVQPFNLVKNELKQYLTEKKKMEALQKYVLDLRATATIDYADETLKPEYIQRQIQESIPKQQEQSKPNFSKPKLKSLEDEEKK